MSYEIVKIDRDDVKKLDPESFLDVDKIEKDLLHDTVVYVAFDSGQPVGIITLEPVGSIFRSSYFFVPEKYRKRRVGTELINAVRSYDPKIYINDSMPGYETMLAAFEHMSIGEVRDVRIYCFDRTEEGLESLCTLEREHGAAVMERLRNHGYETILMSEADGELMEKLGEEMGSGYDEDRNPEYVKGLSPDWSYIVSKDGEPAAFIACARNNDILNVEMLCAHKKYHGTGVALMALFKILDRIISDDGIRQVKAAVMSSDEEIGRLLDDKLGHMITERKKRKLFELA